MDEVIKKAREMRAKFCMQASGGIRNPVRLNTAKFSKFVSEDLGINITEQFLPEDEMPDLLGLYAKDNKGDVIILISEGNNHCWRRFVFIKELCLAFLEETPCTDVEGLASSLIYKDIKQQNGNYAREVSGVIAAIEILIPEQLQGYLAHETNVKRVDSTTLAERLMVPQRFLDFRLRTWGLPVIHAPAK